MQTIRIGASRIQPSRYSIRSRNVGSAHCRSSKAITRGASVARRSSSRRTAQHRLLRGARAAGDSDCARDPGRDLARVGLALDEPLDSLAGNLAGCPPDEVSERPVRDSLAVGEASSGEDGGLFVDARQQLLDEPRLADPGRPDDVDHAALARPDRLLERRAQAAQFPIASDHRRIEPPGEGRRAREHAEQAPRAHGLRLPFQLERLERLDEHRLANEAIRAVADQDLTGLGGRFEPLCRRDGVAGRERLPLARIARNDFARVDPGARLAAPCRTRPAALR